MINKIELHDFKNVKEFNTELKSINILIGENTCLQTKHTE